MGFSFGRIAAGVATGGLSEVYRGGKRATQGSDVGSAILSGIPYIGEGFAAQQQQKYEADQASSARSFNASEAQMNRDFQREMSSTAHQRQVADLGKAGLNPILGVSGVGATTPTGSMASGPSAKGSKASGGGSDNLVRDMMNLTRKKANQDIKTSAALKAVHDTQKQVLQNSAKKIEADTQQTKHQNEIIKPKGDFYKKHGDKMMMMQAVGETANTSRNVIDALNPFSGLIRNVKDLFTGKKSPKSKRKRESFGRDGEHKGTTYDYNY